MDEFPRNQEPDQTHLSPQAFTLVAVIFEAFLAGIAASVGYLLSFPVSKTFQLNWADFGIGLAATVPVILMVALLMALPLGPLRQLWQFMDEIVLPRFRGCHITDLMAIAITAGIGEEMLFRGLIQGYLAESIGGTAGIWTGILVASLIFAMMHMMTLTYALIAGVISLYLGWIWVATGNLLVPITIHAFYDFIVLVYLTRLRRIRA